MGDSDTLCVALLPDPQEVLTTKTGGFVAVRHYDVTRAHSSMELIGARDVIHEM